MTAATLIPYPVVQLRADLTQESLARALYPEAFAGAETAADLRSMIRAYWRLLREKSRLADEWPDGVTPEALARQRGALQLALARVHTRASATYFTTPGWPAHVQEQDPQTRGIWYFLAANISGSDDARRFRLRRDTRNRPMPSPNWHEHLTWLHVDQDSTPVRLSLSTLGFVRFGENPQFQGPAHALAAWARQRGVLVLRQTVDPTPSH